MTPESVLTVGQHALQVTVMLIAVLLLPALAIGLLVSMFQAATQINEVTLSFIPKLLITFFMLIIAGPWMLRTLVTYMQGIIESIPSAIG